MVKDIDGPVMSSGGVMGLLLPGKKGFGGNLTRQVEERKEPLWLRGLECFLVDTPREPHYFCDHNRKHTMRSREDEVAYGGES